MSSTGTDDDDRELQRLRNRIIDLEQRLEFVSRSAEVGSQALVVSTLQKTAYPTAPQSYFWCQVMQVGGTPKEGQPGILTAMPDRFCYAANVGNGLPPQGTQMLVTVDPAGRYVGQYDGGS